MRKLIFTAVAFAGLAAGGSVFAQASGFDAAQSQAINQNNRYAANPANVTPYGPIPGTREYYGNSGWTPDKIYGDNSYPEGYRYRNRYAESAAAAAAAAAARDWRGPRGYDRARETNRGRSDRDHDGIRDRDDRDRDGDGVVNRRDRYPDNPNRN
jgi:hypothetical protein